MHDVLRIARREIGSFFGSPVAYLFLAAFLAVTLFIFFWVETFFARNIADVAPLFDWMPILLIFLVAAITMRMWSEERSAGTLEMLMTAPVSSLRLVLGKFLACLVLIVVALVLTLFLPITAAWLGPLDWGPVVGGYVATLLLAAAYAAIGLFVSARTDNQIVSLIGTVLICAVFWLIGSSVLTGLFGQHVADVLALIGTGSRFASITRGVLDIRDLCYYLSLAAVFLTLNVYSLERLRWQGGAAAGRSHRGWRWAAILLVANFIAVNLWLLPIGGARVDLTRDHLYSISRTTRNDLDALQEPLIIRGYFSKHTNPLLAPLVPQLKNLLREYAEVGGDRVHLAFVNPLDDPQQAKEAAQHYGIQPVPLRSRNKYGSSVVNSYFNVLIKYGDQYETLGFKDLINIKRNGLGRIGVRLRNPEYEITRSIHKVMTAYRSGGNVFDDLDKPVMFHGYFSSAQQLPDKLAAVLPRLKSVLTQMKKTSRGKFDFRFQNPAARQGRLADRIKRQYGIQPMTLGLLGNKTFYFAMVLTQGDRSVKIALPTTLDKAGMKKAIFRGLDRFANGMLHTIALYTPNGDVPPRMRRRQGPSYQTLVHYLRDNANVKRTDLDDGRVPPGTDLLMVISPWQLDDKQLFAIDQFLMRGGSVVIAASRFDVRPGRSGLTAEKRKTGLEKWLAAKGLTLGPSMVLDPQAATFALPVQRDVGGYSIRQIYNLKYPYFPAVRRSGMPDDTLLTTGLRQLAMTWSSPIEVNDKALGQLKLKRILESSPRSWVSSSTDVEPQATGNGIGGFRPRGKRQSRLLGVELRGQFQSWFKNRPNPLLAAADDPSAAGADKTAKDQHDKPVFSQVIAHSPPSARLVVYASASFASDLAMNLIGSGRQTQYQAPAQLLQNTVDASLQDPGLLALRGHSHFSRVLRPLSQGQQRFWEYLNYIVVLLGLLVVYWLTRHLRHRRRDHYRAMLDGRA